MQAGKTALDYAIDGQHNQVIELLKVGAIIYIVISSYLHIRIPNISTQYHQQYYLLT